MNRDDDKKLEDLHHKIKIKKDSKESSGVIMHRSAKGNTSTSKKSKMKKESNGKKISLPEEKIIRDRGEDVDDDRDDDDDDDDDGGGSSFGGSVQSEKSSGSGGKNLSLINKENIINPGKDDKSLW